MVDAERLDFTEEEQLLQDMVRHLAKEKVAAGADERDNVGEFPLDMLELMRENVLMGVDFPEEYGGMAAGLLAHCIVIEELANICMSIAIPLPRQFRNWESSR